MLKATNPPPPKTYERTTIKAGVSLPDFEEFDGIGVDERNRM